MSDRYVRKTRVQHLFLQYIDECTDSYLTIVTWITYVIKEVLYIYTNY